MSISYTRYFTHNIRKVYDVGSIPDGLIDSILSNPDRQKAFEILYTFLHDKKVHPKNLTSRAKDRVNTITQLLEDVKVETYLDIGAGDGNITLAVKDFYKLPKERVFALDKKLPDIPEITALQYQNDKIPLPDNSVDLITLIVVLHHVTDRDAMLSEIKRILKPGGRVYIREHDDNRDPAFFKYLDMLHLLYYIAYNETHDSLYLMTRAEITDLFKRYDMTSVAYKSYDINNPNPQKIYSEVFRKKFSPLQMEDPAYFQKILDVLSAQYADKKKLFLDIIMIAARKEIPIDGIKYIKNESIKSALQELNIQI